MTQLTREDFARDRRRGELLRGRRRPPARRSRARRSPRSRASCSATTGAALRKVSPARHRRRRRRLADRARAGRRRAPPGRRLLDASSTPDELVAQFLRAQVARAALSRGRSCASPMDGRPLIDKPAGMTSHDVVAVVRRAPRRAARRRARRARSTRSRPACCSCWSGAPRASQRFLMALPKRYETVARLGAVSTTGDPEGEIAATGRMPAEPLALPDRRACASARPPTARSRSAASAPTSARGAARRSRCPSAR